MRWIIVDTYHGVPFFLNAFFVDGELNTPFFLMEIKRNKPHAVLPFSQEPLESRKGIGVLSFSQDRPEPLHTNRGDIGFLAAPQLKR